MQRRQLTHRIAASLLSIAPLSGWAQAPATSTSPTSPTSPRSPRKPRVIGPAARVTAVSGKAQLTGASGTKSVVVGTLVSQSETLDTGPGAEVLVRFSDGANALVRPNSSLTVQSLRLSGPPEQQSKQLQLIKGGLRYLSGALTRRQAVKFTTPTATIGIRGTDIEIAINDSTSDDLAAGTVLKVNSGVAVLDASDGSSVDVQAGEWALGTEPELIPRGGGKRRPAARALPNSEQVAAKKLLGERSRFDALLKK